MKKLLGIVFFSSLIFSTASYSQTITPKEIMRRGEMDDLIGYVPKSLDSLVGSSSIIVKGKLGEFLTNQYFFGYDDTRESFKEKHGFTDEEADRWSVPVSDYELIVDEVLLGDIKEDNIVYRILETYPLDREFTNPNVERLFFLVINPDGRTYSPMGPLSIWSADQGNYFYDARISLPQIYEERLLGLVENTEIEAFEKAIRDQIAIEKVVRASN